MKQQAFQTASISGSIVAFSQFARQHGFNVGVQETLEALHCANQGMLSDKASFRYALKSLFCTSPEECMRFEKLFLLFWDTNPMDLKEQRSRVQVRGSQNKRSAASVVMLGMGEVSPPKEEGKQVCGANEMERLRKTDFSKLSGVEVEQLESIAQRMFKELALRLNRRSKENRRHGPIGLKQTIRKSIAYGGEPMDLFRKARRPKKQRLVVLLDVSGSMDQYSYFLLRFICVLRDYFRQLEAFVFSTSLIRISKALQQSRLDFVLDSIGQQADNWSSGTRIGACLGQFNEQYGKLLLNGSPTVLILSDGLDTGDPDLLGKEMVKLRGRSKRIIWLNPLKAMKGYEPTAAGMKAALPSVSSFHNAHSLESLLELEKILADG